MTMKMISFENGTHITLPDEEGRAMVFATGLDPEELPSTFSIHGPEHKVMALMIDLVMIVCREGKDREMVVDFIRVLAEQLNKIIEEEQKHAEKD